MSAHNFLNSFTYGFANGMFNSNPFMFGLGGFSGFNFGSCFASTSYYCSPCSNLSLFMYPGVMNGGFFPLMQDSFVPTPSFNFQNNTYQSFDFFNISDIFQQPWGKLEVNNQQNLLNNKMNIVKKDNHEIKTIINSEKKEEKEKSKIIEDKIQTKVQQEIKTKNDIAQNSKILNRAKQEKFSYSTSSNATSDKKTSNTKIDYDASELKAMWQKKKPNLDLSDEFYSKIIKISKKIQCEPNDLMGIINLETRGTFSPSVPNPSTGATGLIQFMPKYVHEYGTTISKLKNMTREEQLDYVEIYFDKKIKAHKIKGKIDSATLYALVFYPEASNKTGEYIIARKGSQVYRENKSLDANNDRKITKSDLGNKLKQFKA